MEHGLASAYSGFSIMDVSNTMTMDINENTESGVHRNMHRLLRQREMQQSRWFSAVPKDATGMYKVVIIARLPYMII